MTTTNAGQTTTYSLTNGFAVDVGTIPVTQNGTTVNKTIAVLVGSGTVNGTGEPLLAVVDISQPYVPGSHAPFTLGTPYLPQPVGFFQLSANATDVILDGAFALVGTGSNVLIVDLTDPTHPVNGGQITGTFGSRLALDSNGILVAAGNIPSISVQTAAISSPVTVNTVSYTGNCPQVTPPGESGPGAGCINVFNDGVGSAPLIKNPVWKASNAASANLPVAYVQSQTISLDVTLGFSPMLTVDLNNVTITGHAEGVGDCTATGQNFPKQKPTYPFTCTMDKHLPVNQTKFYNPLVVNWSYTASGTTTFIGATKNQVYVTLATPIQNLINPPHPVYRTTLNLAVSDIVAADSISALQNTWHQFAAPIPSNTDPTASGPADIKTWAGRPLYYYPAGAKFTSCAIAGDGILPDESTLLTSASGNGQCTSFAALMVEALATNGILSRIVSIGTANGDFFLVQNWTFTSTPSFQNDPDGYQWKMQFNSDALSNGDFMVPPPQPDSNNYGDWINGTGHPGQNSPTPSEKVFGSHFIVGVPLNGGTSLDIGSLGFYDPSYGVTYPNENGFENTAVAGYAKHVAGDLPYVFRGKPSTGLHNIVFQ